MRKKKKQERKEKKRKIQGVATGDKWGDMKPGAESGREPTKGKSDGALLRDQGRWRRKKKMQKKKRRKRGCEIEGTCVCVSVGGLGRDRLNLQDQGRCEGGCEGGGGGRRA